MQDPVNMLDFLDSYKRHIVEVLEPTKREIKEIFSKWQELTHWEINTENTLLPTPIPIQRFYTRIKRTESVVDKISRKSDSYPNGFHPDSFKRMTDTLGARIVVYFLSQLTVIDREIRNNELLEISSDQRPIAFINQDLATRLGLVNLDIASKESGYNSIHYIVRLKKSSVEEGRRPWFELQLRTLTENIWGEIEHRLGYKPNKRTTFSVKRQFQILSSLLTAIDEHFNLLYEELSRHQTETTINSSDPLNAENLPKVLAEISLRCAQFEINGLLKILASRGFKTVESFLELATATNIETIRNTHISELGRPPTNFDFVASIANLVGCSNESEVIERIKAQIEFLKVWEDLKKRELV